MNRRRYIKRVGVTITTISLAGCTLLSGEDSGTTTNTSSTTQQPTSIQSTTGGPTQNATNSQTVASTPTQTPAQSSNGSTTSVQSQTATEAEEPTTAVRTPEPTPTQTEARTETETRTATQTGTRTQTATRSQTAGQTTTGQVIDGVIVSFDPVTGTFSPGEVQTAQIEVENLGNVTNTFYLGYSVVGPDGEGYFNGGSPASIRLSPGGSGNTTADWTVTASSPEGTYGAKTTLRESWDGEDFGETLDNASESEVFEVVQD